MSDMLDAIRLVMLSMTQWAWEMTVICHPDDEEATQKALDAVPESNGRVRLLVRNTLQPGRLLLFNDEELDVFKADFVSDLMHDGSMFNHWRFMSFSLSQRFQSVTMA